MIPRSHVRSNRTAGLAVAAALALPSLASGEGAYEKLIADVAPSIVTVSMVVKMEMSFAGQSQSRESREEHSAVVVDASGLLMMDYQPFASTDDEDGGQFKQKRTPTEIKVIFDGNDKEYESELVATDKKLGLAFVKVKDLAGHTPKVVSFAAAADAELGDELAAVSRLQKGYDYAPYVETAKVNGKLKKPRKALMLDNPGVTGIGLPVFTMNGEVVGAMVGIDPGIKEDDDGFGFFMRMAGGGQRFLLPGKVVAAQIELAMKQAAGEAPKDADAAKPEDGAGDEGGGK